MGQVRFEKQHYGAVVATILETDNSIVEVQEHNDGVYGLIIHTRRYDRDHWDDLTAYLKPEHFDALGSVARRMRGEQEAQEPELSLCGYCRSWRSRPCGEGCCWEAGPLGPLTNHSVAAEG